jgi:PAS domain S-box-containing protein
MRKLIMMEEIFESLFKKQNIEKTFKQMLDIFEYWPELIAVLDNKKKIIYGNNRFFNFTRYNKEELIGQSLSKLFSKEDLTRLYKIDNPKTICRRLSLKVKTRGEISVDANHWQIDLSQPVHLYLFRYKQKIREIEKSLVLANVGYMEIDKSGSILDSNESVISLFDLDGIYSDSGELRSKNIANIVSKEGAEKCKTVVLDKFGTKEKSYTECEMTSLRGGKKIFSINIMPDYNLEFQRDVMKVLIVDLTDLKTYQKELTKQSNMYQSLINVAPIGIMLVNSNGDIVEYNEYLATMMGASETFIGKNINEISSFLEVSLAKDIRNVIKNGEGTIGQKEYVSEFGKKISLSYAFVAIKEEDDEFNAFGILEDVSRKTR